MIQYHAVGANAYGFYNAKKRDVRNRINSGGASRLSFGFYHDHIKKTMTERRKPYGKHN